MEDVMRATMERAALIVAFFLATWPCPVPGQTAPPPEQQQPAFTSGELVRLNSFSAGGDGRFVGVRDDFSAQPYKIIISVVSAFLVLRVGFLLSSVLRGVSALAFQFRAQPWPC
jgi:hypothetical protein